MSRMNFNMVSSGSKGNCTLIWDDDTLLVFDFGITMKRFRERLNLLGIDHREYSMFISHEHTDHTRGVKMISKYDRFDLYSRELTLNAMGIRDGFSIYDSTAIGNFLVRTISISHDAADPVGFVVESGRNKISIVSDLGTVSQELIDAARNSNILAFEANHDVEMLRNGGYPEVLKRRILSNQGHLSNEQSADALTAMTGPLTNIVLTHLSEHNNTPDTALETIKSHLDNRSIMYGSIECASQSDGSSLLVVGNE